VTRVLAKQAKTTKVKNNFINGKKKFKRILSCLFGGRQKVQFRRKNLGEKVQAKSSNLPQDFIFVVYQLSYKDPYIGSRPINLLSSS